MNQPRPWREGAEDVDPRVARVVRSAASVAPRELDRAGWDEVLARAARPHRDPRLVPAFLLSVLAGVGLVLVARAGLPTPAGPPMAQAVPVVAASPGATFTRETSERVVLTSGQLRLEVAAGASLQLRTPHVEVETQRGRFLAEVTETGTLITVEEGEVTLRGPGGTRVLRAGESVTMPPAPEIPAALLVEPVEAPGSCAAAEGAHRLDCLKAEAAGNGLEAQAALYELGVSSLRAGEPADAERALRESIARFPDGVLHPEVRLALLLELVRSRRFTDALVVARDFERLCADDPRVGDVARLRTHLESTAAAR